MICNSLCCVEAKSSRNELKSNHSDGSYAWESCENGGEKENTILSCEDDKFALPFLPPHAPVVERNLCEIVAATHEKVIFFQPLLKLLFLQKGSGEKLGGMWKTAQMVLFETFRESRYVINAQTFHFKIVLLYFERRSTSKMSLFNFKVSPPLSFYAQSRSLWKNFSSH